MNIVKPKDESQRLAALRAYDLLDTGPEQMFKRYRASGDFRVPRPDQHIFSCG